LTVAVRRLKTDILVYEDNIEKDFQTVAVVDWNNLDKKVKEPAKHIPIAVAQFLGEITVCNI